MHILAKILAGFVAIEHIGILVLEMFFWNHPIGAKVFDKPIEVMAESAVLAANQGLYNGFLAAGLIWGLLSSKRDVVIFFLGCVIVAGIFGSMTAKFTILFSQALPATLAMAAVLFLRAKNESL